MKPRSFIHPASDRLASYALRLLDEGDATRIRLHLIDCHACRALLEALPEQALLSLSSTRMPERQQPPASADTPTSGMPAVPPARKLGPPGLPSTLPQLDAGPGLGDVSALLATGAGVPDALMNHPRYEVLGVLGAGGMGVVYQARHRLMDRLVALKVIHPGLVDRPGMVERFRREVLAAARLSHPNIVTAFDAEQAGGTHFLVLEYIEGTDLERVLGVRHRLPVGLACEYARQAALGLQHAHERGMVHRDIKPHNLMVTPAGQVKILDFGLARLLSETLPPVNGTEVRANAGEANPLTPLPTGTTSGPGTVLGTVDYAAPEEARVADIRADLYSLGCTLYRLLTGQVPFPGGTFKDKVRAHAQGQPVPLATLVPEAPPGLAAVVARLMAKDPARRYQAPAEAAQALVPFAAPAAHTVLVVDDDVDIREAMRLSLEDAGYTVTEAAHGRDALDQLHGGLRPNLILLDLMMPTMDGWEFLREQRADPALAGIPVLIVTAGSSAEARAVAQGAAGYLQKPVDVGQLTQHVHDFTSRN